MPARPTQKSLPLPRSTTMSDFSAAPLISLVSSRTLSSVTALPRSGALRVTRRIGPSCCTRISSAIFFLLFEIDYSGCHEYGALPLPVGERVGVRGPPTLDSL